ncbi:MAG: biotin--[acetyl-CoA-carboxylase] ligase [Deltaproteobacteria bacterium]|nr:biotin--[acetyl-CoA-carboxylase] ligase [Deltaproteobacteria bacterium]
MLVYSDNPKRFDGFFPSHAPWRKIAVNSGSEAETRLLEVLGCTGEIWSTRIDRTSTGFWSRVVAIAEAPWSQYDALQTLLQDENTLSEPAACLALTGLGFHGQRGRPWKAEPGNLHLSVFLAPNRPVQELIPALTMLPAVAVVAAIQKATGDAIRPGIKWVNDILVDGGKVSGVLTTTQIKSRTVQACVLGIGVNLARAPEVAPTPFVPKTSCLADSGLASRALELSNFFWILLGELENHYLHLLEKGPSDLFHRYVKASLVIGRKVRIMPEIDTRAGACHTSPEALAEGVVESISPDLSLKLDSQSETISHGRLVLY